MATEKQIEANRANAQKSTGPRTEQGKAKSRYNALKHGLRAEQVLIAGEDPAEFAVLQEEVFDEFQPRTRSEAEIVAQIAMDTWRLRRIPRLEAAMGVLKTYKRLSDEHGPFGRMGRDEEAEAAADKDLEQLYPGRTSEDLQALKALGQLIAAEGLADMARLATYQDKIARQIDRSLKRLRDLRNLAASQADVEGGSVSHEDFGRGLEIGEEAPGPVSKFDA